MDGNQKKRMLFGSISVASVVILLTGSMISSFFIDNSSYNPPKEVNIIEWDIVVPDDYPTLYDAIESAVSGQSIFVRSGIYYLDKGLINNPITFNKPDISICGEDKNNTIIDGRRLATVVYINADNVSFQGFTFKNNGINGSLLRVFSSNNIIKNNNFLIYDFQDGIEYGVKFNNANNNLFSFNHVYGGEYGIDIGSSHNNIFSYNLIENNEVAVDVDPIYTIDSSRRITEKIYRDPCTNNQFISNIIRNNNVGLTIAGSSNNTIFNNSFISNNLRGLILSKCSNFVIRNNGFISDSLDIRGSELVHFVHIVENNLVNGKHIFYTYNQDDFGVPIGVGQIILVDCSYVDLENIIISNTSTAVLLAFCDYVYVENCVFSYNIYGIYLYFSTYCSIERNNFIRNRRNVNFISLGIRNVKKNKFRQNYWEGSLLSRIRLFKISPQGISGRFYLRRPLKESGRSRIPFIITVFDWRPARKPYDIY